MPKRVNLLPNERIDIPDFAQAAQNFAVQQQQQLINRDVLDRFARVADGFRVEIANQVTNPGSLTVHNGVAEDRSGQLVNNEDDVNTARSVTLSLNGTYFLEVQFVTAESDVDARAFWDPTFDNGIDPSGDQRLAGREFAQNVATRISPDWQIVTPVSTSGFEILSNANSTKIPLAVITVAGGAVVGASTFPAKSTLERAALIGNTSLKVFDSRVMPNSFTATVDDTETVTVTANDRENGILTLSAGLTVDHGVGGRVTVAGVSPTQFLGERTTPISYTQPLPSSGTQDARPRLWGGDEERGFGLTQDPYTDAGRNDLQIKSRKDYVDFISGQLREIKWGASAAAGFGQAAPIIPPSAPRYYDFAGGLIGTRAHTVSVGDGVNSWGDFNTTGFTTSGADTAAKLAIQAAINQIPLVGGILYIKRGTYDIGANPLIVNRPIFVMGDGKSASIIRGPGSSTTIAPTATTDVHFEKIAITQPAGATISAIKAAVTVTRMTMRDCDVTGVELTGVDHGYFANCVFNGPDSTPGPDDPFDAILTNCHFEDCDFNEFAAGNSNCLNVRPNSLETGFYRCKFAGSSTINDRIIFVDTNSTRISFTDCRVIGGFANTCAFRVADGVTFLTLRGCHTTTQAGLLTSDQDGCTDFVIDGCSAVFTTASSTRRGISFVRPTPTVTTRHRIMNCKFEETGIRDATNGIGIWWEYCSDNVVENCVFVNCDIGISMLGVNGNIHKHNKHFCSLGFGRVGEKFEGTGSGAQTSFGNHLLFNTYLGLSDSVFVGGVAGVNLGTQAGGKTRIEGCEFLSIGRAQNIDAFGVFGDTTSSTYFALTILNNWFEDINGGAAGLKGCEGIHLGDPVGTSNGYNFLRICNNLFSNIGYGVTNNFSSGVSCSKFQEMVIANNSFNSIGNPAGVDNAGIVVGWQGTTFEHGQDYTITGNTFRDIRGPGTGSTWCIEVLQSGHRGVISNNAMRIDSSNVGGIVVSGNSTVGTNNGSLSICGNVIGGSHPFGINVLQPADKLENRRYVISNNVISDSQITAINVDLGDDNDFPFPACTVSGNVIESSDASVTGIAILDCDMAAVTGNSISLPNSTDPGVLMLFCRRFTVNDNCIFVPNDLAIRIDSCSTGNVVGNQLIACLVFATNGGKFWVVGNHAALNPLILGPSVAATEAAGAVAYQTARGLNAVGPDNSGTNPGTFFAIGGDIWLNLSTP